MNRPSETRCAERPAVAAYALGVLDPDERDHVRAHLETCADCRAELAELEDLPRLLASVPDADLPADPEPPSDLAYRRLRHAADEQRRRQVRARLRGRRLVAAAVAAAAVLAGAVGVTATLVGDRPPAPAVVAAASGQVHARATVTSVPTGSAVALSLSGVPYGTHCRLVAVARDGHRETASTWTASYAGTATVTGSLAITPAQIDHFTVQTLDGRNLLTLPGPVT